MQYVSDALGIEKAFLLGPLHHLDLNLTLLVVLQEFRIRLAENMSNNTITMRLKRRSKTTRMKGIPFRTRSSSPRASIQRRRPDGEPGCGPCWIECGRWYLKMNHEARPRKPGNMRREWRVGERKSSRKKGETSIKVRRESFQWSQRERISRIIDEK